MNPFSKKIKKPWGYEILLTAEDSPVTGKIAFTKAGHRWSFQYHDRKEETISLFSGEAEIWLENEAGEIEKIKMIPMSGYQVKSMQKHRFCAISDCWTFESSTPEKGNTFRLEDDYARETETEELRSLPGRGWK